MTYADASCASLHDSCLFSDSYVLTITFPDPIKKSISKIVLRYNYFGNSIDVTAKDKFYLYLKAYDIFASAETGLIKRSLQLRTPVSSNGQLPN